MLTVYSTNIDMKALLLCVFTTCCFSCFSQDDAGLKKVFRASISQAGGSKAAGYVAAIDDSTISLAAKAPSFRMRGKENAFTTFNYQGIEKVVIRRKGAVGRGILYGVVIGAGTFAIAGFLSGSDPPRNIIAFSAGQKAIIGGFAGAIAGAIAGGIIGAVARKTWKIGRQKQAFYNMRLRLTSPK